MNKSIRQLVTIIIVLVVVLGGGYLLLQRNGSVPGGLVKDSGSNISDYSAVFLTNGQVYFGKINAITTTEVDIRDIYYLQVNQDTNLQTGNNNSNTAANPEISLVKLGNELHGPNDRMRINRDQVLFTESLKDDSKVVTAIKDYQDNN